ncbi:MAG TPA: hypothetical protein VGC67_12650 [Cellulomonas sp.]
MSEPIVPDPAGSTVYAPGLRREYEPERAPWAPPVDARVVVSVLVHAPCYDDDPPADVVRPAAMQGGVGRETGEPRHGQVARLSQWDFGLTVGTFRLLRIAERLGVPVAVALDARGVARMPGLAAAVAAGAGEVVARGAAANHVLHPGMTPAQEQEYVARSLATVRAAVGRPVDGWFSPERATTARTPTVLAGAGVRWFGEWPVDERPVPLDGAAAGVQALPFALETEDMFALYTRAMRSDDYEVLLNRTLDALLADAERVGTRFLGLSWFGWVLGQACFADVAERFLARLVEQDGVHLALPGDVAGL